jgi:hypothetical protein
MSVEGVTGELLVRYLDTWVPTALHAGRRATFVQAWPGAADVAAAESVLRVFAEFADRLSGRRVALVFVAPEPGETGARLAAVQAELRTPPELAVHPVAGRAETHLSAVLTAAQGAGAPIFAYVHSDGDLPVRAVAAGRPAELMALTPPGRHAEYAETLHSAGFTLVSFVELVADDESKLLAFGTTSLRSLEAFKNALWQLDEWAGVRIRDPHDAEGHLLDISLRPHPGPLRRGILAYLAEQGEHSVTEIRRFALTQTVYRVADVTDVLTGLVTSGAVTRTPPHGRLSGDTVLAAVHA